MPKIIDETNNTYNCFKVIGLDKNNTTKRRKWLCECQNCHNIISVYGTNLRSNKIPKCQYCENNKLNGKQFGRLKILSYVYTATDRHKYYKCQCECGNIETIKGTSLISKERTQCLECNKQQRQIHSIDETGKKYGRLTVLEKYLHPTDKKNAWWICQCECGNIVYVKGVKLRNGHTQSCGCLKSKGEEKINYLLSKNNIIYKTQISFPDCIYKEPLKFDFAIYNKNNQLLYLIEYDGKQHFYPVPFFGGEKRFEEQQKRDQIKNEYCQKNHIPLLRIPYTQLEKLTIQDLILGDNYE